MPGPASYQNGFPYNANGEIRILITGGPTPPSGTIPASPPSNGGLYVSMLPPNVAPVYLKDRVSVEYVPGKGRQFTPYGQLAQLEKIFDDQIAAARNRIAEPVDRIIDRVNAVFRLVNTHVGNDPRVISSEKLLREANHGLQVANSEVQLSEGNVSQKHEAAEKALNDVKPKLGLSGVEPEDYDALLTRALEPVSRSYWEEYSVKPRVEEFNAKQRLLAALDNIAVVIQDVESKASTLTDVVNQVNKERADAETKAKAEEEAKAKAETEARAKTAELMTKAGVKPTPVYTPEMVKSAQASLAAVGAMVLNRAPGMLQLSTAAEGVLTTTSELAGSIAGAVWRGAIALAEAATVSTAGATVSALVMGFWPTKAGEGSDKLYGRDIVMFGFQANLIAAGKVSISPEMHSVDLPVRGSLVMENGQQQVKLVKTGIGGVPASVSILKAVRDEKTGLDRITLPAVGGAPSRTILVNPAPVGPTAPPHTGNSSPAPVTPVHTGTTVKQADSIVTTSFPADDLKELQDFIYWQPDATGSGVEPIYVMLSDPLDSGRFTRKQLDKKFKHAIDFGISDTKKNSETLTKFRDEVNAHLADKETVERGTYRREKGSKVYFNPKSMRVVILKANGDFLSGWKINPDADNGRIYLETGDL
ncbi:S-type pyocin domain-containing protein [Serratia plymuthica]|uniref:Colicin-D n=2 Tax=Serratia plymuthica TaxID=82996 RepID=A0A2X4UCE4_SERPL|nr:S-type pyocin domain-containing protein [Serratia plymuthica]RKS63257.1 colicin D [Serratia plymuthica]CAI2523006.1 Colicin-D [Serratia plymuthica]SQI30550.1 Colicin-D [Serratia plymuthica]